MKTKYGLIMAAIMLSGICGQKALAADADAEQPKEKVLIDGKWGNKPGEFGKVSPRDAEFVGLLMENFSLTVGCDDSIYALDSVNNRIQKFDANGIYLKSIPIIGCADLIGTPCFQVTTLPNGRYHYDINENLQRPITSGMNIVVDQQGALYYYAMTDTDGEIWKFQDDKLVSKSTAPFSNAALAGLGLTFENNSLWLFNVGKDGDYYRKHYNYTEHRFYFSEEVNEWRSRGGGSIGKCDPEQKRRKITWEITENGLLIARKGEK